MNRNELPRKGRKQERKKNPLRWSSGKIKNANFKYVFYFPQNHKKEEDLTTKHNEDLDRIYASFYHFYGHPTTLFLSLGPVNQRQFRSR